MSLSIQVLQFTGLYSPPIKIVIFLSWFFQLGQKFFVDNILQKKNLELGPYASSFLILLDRDYFMGEGAEEIKFLISKPVYVKNVVLILTPK